MEGEIALADREHVVVVANTNEDGDNNNNNNSNNNNDNDSLGGDGGDGMGTVQIMKNSMSLVTVEGQQQQQQAAAAAVVEQQQQRKTAVNDADMPKENAGAGGAAAAVAAVESKSLLRGEHHPGIGSRSSTTATSAAGGEVVEVRLSEDIYDGNHGTEEDDRSNHHHYQWNQLYEDHCTLKTPTSRFRFRGRNILVNEMRDSQIQFEEKTTAVATTKLASAATTTSAGAGGVGVVSGVDDDDPNRLLQQVRTTIIVIKDVKIERTGGLNLLRLVYSVVTFFYAGMLFLVSFQILLFMFMDLIASAGLTSAEQADGVRFVGTLLSLPVFLYGLATAMVIAGAFIADVWNGNPFLKCVGEWDPMYSEWFSFGVLLGIPALIISITLLIGLSNWWEISLLCWFSLITVYYVVFAFSLLYYELQAGWFVLQQLHPVVQRGGGDEGGGDDDNDNDGSTTERRRRWFQLLCKSIVHRQTWCMMGTSKVIRVTTTTNVDKKDRDVTQQQSRYDVISVYTKWTLSKYNCNLLEQVDPPVRVYSTEEILGTRRFITKDSWSLEKIFCSNQRSQSVNVIQGSAALLPKQIMSSLVCNFIGIGLVLLLVVALLVFYYSSWLFVILVVIVVLLSCFPRMRSAVTIYNVYQDSKRATSSSSSVGGDLEESNNTNNNNDDGQQQQLHHHKSFYGRTTTADDGDGGSIYQSFEKYRVSKPATRLCWMVFWLEIGLFVVWPVVTLFLVGANPSAGLFLILSIISFFRFFINPSILLKEYGSLEFLHLGGHQKKNDREETNENDNDSSSRRRRQQQQQQQQQQNEWRAKARLRYIMQHISRGPGRDTWVWVFLFLAIFIIIFAVSAMHEEKLLLVDPASSSSSSTTTTTETADTSMVLLPADQFQYPPQPYMQYPTCAIGKGMDLPHSSSAFGGTAGGNTGRNATGLADFAFLAALMYEPVNVFQDKLDSWFGSGTAKDQKQFVYNFRQTVPGGNAAVSYNVVTFSSKEEGGGGGGGDHNLAVVTVRGSTTSWEWLTDAQIWSAAAVAGVVRLLLPLGQVWTPILDNLLDAVEVIQPHRLQQVSLYQQTSKLVQVLKSSGNFSAVYITGQSLGGGISLITGAQQSIPAIAISGPNLKMSRKTVIPEVSVFNIDNFLFNVIPNRDIVPRVDDPGILYQRIECRANPSDLFGCHSATRSLCEIMYRCGTMDRPPLCDCATKYGYPEADQIAGNQTFTDLCGPTRSNDGYYTDVQPPP